MVDTAAPTPRLAATVVLLRPAAAGIEVLLIERHMRSDVHGGVHVFPGGKVEPGDGGPDVPLDVRLRKAAVRELREECGVDVAAADLAPFSRWVTPVGTSSAKRFDTAFFLAAMPAGQAAVADQHEAVSLLWITPAGALRRYWHDEIKLAPPQIMSLASLAAHADIDAAIAAANGQVAPEVMPEHVGQGEERVIAFPGDPLHTRPARVMPGPTRLHVRNGRYEPVGGFDDFGVA